MKISLKEKKSFVFLSIVPVQNVDMNDCEQK